MIIEVVGTLSAGLDNSNHKQLMERLLLVLKGRDFTKMGTVLEGIKSVGELSGPELARDLELLALMSKLVKSNKNENYLKFLFAKSRRVHSKYLAILQTLQGNPKSPTLKRNL